MLKLFFEISRILERKDRVILAIDGRCTGGKTTLAENLRQKLDCNVIHMDDFFLQPHQRTAERLGEPGGNVDRERFREEVILPLTHGESFSYRPYLCDEQRLGDPIAVPQKRLTVIEGTYSHHPYFGDPYDLKVFCAVTPEEQHRRILTRPEYLHKRFFEEWIPMEEAYFSHFSIMEKCDLVMYDDSDPIRW